MLVSVAKKLDGGKYVKASESCEHKDTPLSSDFVRATTGKCGYLATPIEVKDKGGKVIRLKTKRLYFLSVNGHWGGMLGLFKKQIAQQTNKLIGNGVIENKKIVERILASYKPMPKVEKLTWKEHLW